MGTYFAALKKSGGSSLARFTLDGNGKSYVTTSEVVLRPGHVLPITYSLHKYRRNGKDKSHYAQLPWDCGIPGIASPNKESRGRSVWSIYFWLGSPAHGHLRLL